MIVLFAMADIFRLNVLKDFEGLEDFSELCVLKQSKLNDFVVNIVINTETGNDYGVAQDCFVL